MTTKAETRQKAEIAYNTALQTGDCAAWEQAARLLYQALPAQRQQGPKVKAYKRGRCSYPIPLAHATFADGTEIRMSFWSHKDGPIDFERARKVCERIWRKRAAERRHPIYPVRCPTEHDYNIIARTKRLQRQYARNVAVPEVVRIIETSTGEVWRNETDQAA